MKTQLTFRLAALLVTAVATAQTLTTAFTYQGRLTELGALADGEYDLEFRLHDAPAGGAQIGSTLFADGLDVVGGLFTVVLDFGPGVFTGDRLWLEVAVRPGASTGAFTVLAPRQELTATPHASVALASTTAASAPWSGLTSVPVGFSDGIDDVDDTVSWAEVSGVVGSGPQQIAEGNHNHPESILLDLNVDANGDIKITADPFSPDTNVYQGRVTKLFLKDLPNLLQALGGSGITLAHVNANVKIIMLSVETFNDAGRVTFTAYRWGRVTGNPAGTDETDIYWPVKVAEDTLEATEDSSVTYKLFQATTHLY